MAKSSYCQSAICTRKVFEPHMYCDAHVDFSSTPPGMLNPVSKLKAVETYLQWPIDTAEEMSDVLNRIWFAVMEDTILPHPSEGKK